MKQSSLILGAILGGLLILAACNAAPRPSPTPVPTATSTETPLPSDTPVPSDTPTPLPTETSTQTLTPTQTVTPSATPGPNFSGFLIQYTQAIPNGTQFGFKIPGITQPLKLTVNSIEYKCTVSEKTPDMLYCSGKQFNQNQNVKLAFYPLAGSDKSIFETSIKIAYEKTPTPDPRALAAQAPSCPDRGKNVTGEIEWRKYNSGYCVVATCFDACGYYYSLNTCPSGTEHNGIYQFAGPTPAVCK